MSIAFISHASLDKTVADAVVEALEREGISCWIAPRNIPAGSNYGAAIIQAIRDCDVLILLLSESSNTSAAVFREVQKAFEENKNIIPLRLQDIPVSDNLGFYLSGLHWIDADPEQKDFDDLIYDVRLALEKTPYNDSHSSGGVAKQKNRPRKKMATSTKNILIATLCVILCLTLAISAFLFINRSTEPQPIVISIYLTLNPVIRIDIDENGRVLDIVPMNDEAVPIVDSFSLEDREIAETINELVDRAVDLGFIGAGTTITASINVPDDASFAQTQDILQGISTELIDRVAVTLEVNRHDDYVGLEQGESVDPTQDSASPALDEENVGQDQGESTDPTQEPTRPELDEENVEPTPELTRLTRDEALQIALDFADVTREQISDLDTVLYRRGDRMVWEVDFEVERHDDDDDWEFYIDAYTGEILYWERD